MKLLPTEERTKMFISKMIILIRTNEEIVWIISYMKYGQS